MRLLWFSNDKSTLSFQMLDNHLLIPWGLEAAVSSPSPSLCRAGKQQNRGGEGTGTRASWFEKMHLY